jgi:uncharacterized protein
MSGKMKAIDIIYLALPILLWPIVFLGFPNLFVYAMSVATLILAIFTLVMHKELIQWKKTKKYVPIILSGLMGAAILYFVFVAGAYLAGYFGLFSYVQLVYSMIYAQASKVVIFLLLALIGICEEIYWRGGVQAFAKKSRLFKNMPWLGTTIYYSLVHIPTLNPILVLAAFFVGLVTSLIADRYGIFGSMIAHIAWIECIIIFLPVIAIH